MLKHDQMRASAHESAGRTSNTVGMQPSGTGGRNFGADEQPISRSSNTERVGVVSGWFDGELMAEADLSCELAGRKVIAAPGAPDHATALSHSMLLALSSTPGTSGFLFLGDDGDSLWFWPGTEKVAFRLEPQARDELRRSLSTDVDALVSQGALVFCYHSRIARDVAASFRFPVYGLQAA